MGREFQEQMDFGTELLKLLGIPEPESACRVYIDMEANGQITATVLRRVDDRPDPSERFEDYDILAKRKGPDRSKKKKK